MDRLCRHEDADGYLCQNTAATEYRPWCWLHEDTFPVSQPFRSMQRYDTWRTFGLCLECHDKAIAPLSAYEEAVLATKGSVHLR